MRRDGGFVGGGIRDGEIGDGETEERGCEETILYLNPNLINMKVHSATCSCSVELYKLWYTLADFFPNRNFARGFLYVYLIYITGRISALR